MLPRARHAAAAAIPKPCVCFARALLQVFGPAFRRNSRWSEKEGVPDVGDEATSWEDVCKFYDFWWVG